MANVRTQIKKSKESIQDVMQMNLASIADSMIDQVIGKANSLPKAQILNSTKDIKPKGINAYKSDLQATLAVVSSMALDQARKEVPKASKVKLMENEERLLFGEFENLPSGMRKRIKNSNDLLVGTHIADLKKAIFFQFSSSVGKEIIDIESDEAKEIVKEEMHGAAAEYIVGNAIQAGSSVVAANVVNEARNAFFFQKDVLQEIEAFQFMNGDPVSIICNDLDGLIFDKNDPNAFRYTPPLHYNCKSWIRPILRLVKGQKVEKFKPSTSKIENTIQFSDFYEAASHDCQIKCCINL